MLLSPTNQFRIKQNLPPLVRRKVKETMPIYMTQHQSTNIPSQRAVAKNRNQDATTIENDNLFKIHFSSSFHKFPSVCNYQNEDPDARQIVVQTDFLHP